MNKLLCVFACLFLASCVTSHNLAYDRAHVHGPDNPDDMRGLLLILHGCDGGFPHHWWQYMLKQGFLTIWINSFEDPRPPEGCRTTRAHADAIASIRERQTAYALAQIAKTYPGQPVIVWGHSEGATFAQLIDEPVAGIITTGQLCARRGLRIRPEVPWFHVLSNRDPWHIGKAHNCAGAQYSEAWSYLILPGSAHRPAIQSFEAPLLDLLERALN